MDRLWCMGWCFKQVSNCLTSSLADSFTMVAACLALLHMTLRHLLTCTALMHLGGSGSLMQQPSVRVPGGVCSALRPL